MKKHGTETKDANGKRVISDKLRTDLQKEAKRLGLPDSWEPEQVRIGTPK